MKKVFFDTETTGLPEKGKNWETDYLEFPFVVQLAWKDTAGGAGNFIIRPEGYLIPEEASAIHGITDKLAHDQGLFFRDVVPQFIETCLTADRIIGHNVYFDTSILKACVKRTMSLYPEFPADYADKSVTALHKDKRIDTMQKTISFCSIPFPDGRKGKKWPTLQELYVKLFGETFNAHNAWDDVLAVERCYNELVRLGVLHE